MNRVAGAPSDGRQHRTKPAAACIAARRGMQASASPHHHRTSSKKVQDMKNAATWLAAAIALTLTTTAVHARADIGVLTCKLKDVKNDIVYTKEEFGCEFKPNVGDVQTYTGEIKALGVNLSVTKDVTLVWGVLAPSSDAAEAGALAGRYFGGTASVALGAGAAANVLIGGSKHTVALQPISASGIIGTGAALDVEEFELR